MELGSRTALTSTNEGLRRAELSFRAFIERTPNAVGMHRDGVIIYVNPAMVSMLGYASADELVGRPVVDFVLAEDHDAVRERVRAMTETNEPSPGVPALQERLLRRDGCILEAEVSALPIAFEGKPTVLVFAVDISARNRVQRELDRSCSLLRATLQSTADGLLVVDNEGRLSTWNDKFLEMWRIPRAVLDLGDDEKALAHVLDQLVDPQGFVARIRELYARPELTSHEVIELVDGRVYERYSQAQKINGECVGRVWSFRDVTARRRAEAERERLLAEISAKHDLMRAIHANMVDGLSVCDAEGHITLVNQAEVSLMGAESPEALERPLAEYAAHVGLTHMEGRPVQPAELPLARALTGEKVMGATFRVAKGDRALYVRANATPIRGADGVIVGAVAVQRDVSDVIEFDRLKDQFVRVAAHELKTPVAILKGYAQLLLRAKETLPDAPRGAVEAIERGADRINGIVSDLLDISQLHLGHMEIRREKLDLTELVESVIRRFEVATGRHIERVGTTPCVVRGDRARLEQVLGNLLDNAIRYSPLGGDVEVSLGVEGNAAAVCVRDHGVGIPPEKQQDIFTCFYRAHTDTPHDYGGMGVGLFLSREIVARHGGTMWFESTWGSGSRFCFRLPA